MENNISFKAKLNCRNLINPSIKSRFENVTAKRFPNEVLNIRKGNQQEGLSSDMLVVSLKESKNAILEDLSVAISGFTKEDSSSFILTKLVHCLKLLVLEKDYTEKSSILKQRIKSLGKYVKDNTKIAQQLKEDGYPKEANRYKELAIRNLQTLNTTFNNLEALNNTTSNKIKKLTENYPELKDYEELIINNI